MSKQINLHDIEFIQKEVQKIKKNLHPKYQQSSLSSALISLR